MAAERRPSFLAITEDRTRSQIEQPTGRQGMESVSYKELLSVQSVNVFHEIKNRFRQLVASNMSEN